MKWTNKFSFFPENKIKLESLLRWIRLPSKMRGNEWEVSMNAGTRAWALETGIGRRPVSIYTV